jgi:hypothetical protein
LYKDGSIGRSRLGVLRPTLLVGREAVNSWWNKSNYWGEIRIESYSGPLYGSQSVGCNPNCHKETIVKWPISKLLVLVRRLPLKTCHAGCCYSEHECDSPNIAPPEVNQDESRAISVCCHILRKRFGLFNLPEASYVTTLSVLHDVLVRLSATTRW